MDEIATKAITIGVAVFITIVIFTVVLLEFGQISDIYSQTAETNITFEDRLDEFDKYRDSNNRFIGLDVVNTVAKYKDDTSVQVCVDEGSLICGNSINIGKEDYNKRYRAEFTEVNGIFRIKFSRSA